MEANLERRRVALASLGLSAALLAPSAVATVADDGELHIEAMEDSFVERVLSSNGLRKAGDPLLQLKSYKLLHAQLRIAGLKQQIEISERPFSDGRVDAEIKAIKDKAANLSAIYDVLQKRFQAFEEAVKIGVAQKDAQRWSSQMQTSSTASAHTAGKSDEQSTSNSSNVYDPRPPTCVLVKETNGTGKNLTQSSSDESSQTSSWVANPAYLDEQDQQLALLKAKNDSMEAQLTADQADKRKLDALDKFELVRRKLSEVEQLLTDLMARQLVKCPRDGVLTLNVEAGSFIKKGHALGSLK